MITTIKKSVALVVMVKMAVVVVAADGSCSKSCLVEQGIISCRRFDRPADIRACARRRPSASVLDLSYIDIRRPLTRRSLSGLRNIVVLYLDGSRFRRMDPDALTGMPRLYTVFARKMGGRLQPVLDAVKAAPSTRQVLIADNFVVCSCSWLRAVDSLSSVDIVIADFLDAAPKCSDETVERCRGGRNDSATNGTVYFYFAQVLLKRRKNNTHENNTQKKHRDNRLKKIKIEKTNRKQNIAPPRKPVYT